MKKDQGLTLLEVLLVLVVLAIVAGVIYTKVIRPDTAKRGAAVLEMLRLKQGIAQLIESRGVTDLTDQEFRNSLDSLLSGRVSPLGGTYSFTTDSDSVTLIHTGGPDFQEIQAFASVLAKRVCPECDNNADPVACCPAVTVAGNQVEFKIVWDE